jgi:hypothetical protein
MRAADAAAELVELSQAELIRAVDDDGVGVRKVQARLDDGRADQHLGLVFEKVQHDLLELFRPHLPVRHGDSGFRHRIGELERDAFDRFDAVVEKENLAAALQLAQDGIADHAIIVTRDIGLDRQPVERRRLDDAQIADSHQRHVQRARDRRSRQADDVDQLAQLFQPLLVGHAETMLLIDNHQSQVLELDVLLQ